MADLQKNGSKEITLLYSIGASQEQMLFSAVIHCLLIPEEAVPRVILALTGIAQGDPVPGALSPREACQALMRKHIGTED